MKRRDLIHHVRCDKRGITIFGTREYLEVTGIQQMTYVRCGRRHAEFLFLTKYGTCRGYAYGNKVSDRV